MDLFPIEVSQQKHITEEFMVNITIKKQYALI